MWVSGLFSPADQGAADDAIPVHQAVRARRQRHYWTCSSGCSRSRWTRRCGMLLPGSVLDAGRETAIQSRPEWRRDRLPVCVRPRHTRASGRLCPAQVRRLSGLPHGEQQALPAPGTSCTGLYAVSTSGIMPTQGLSFVSESLPSLAQGRRPPGKDGIARGGIPQVQPVASSRSAD